MTDFKSIAQWAEIYRSRGWNVIPLFDYAKSPTKVDTWDDDFGWMPGWKPLENRMATDKEFNHWFKEQTPSGIAVVTGKISGIIVVDEDSYKENGMKFEQSSPLRAKTARDGTHHFFKYSESVGTMGYKVGVNIEIKSDGGIVVLPPSTVWTNKEKTTTGQYQWVSKHKLDQLPQITEKHVEPFQRVGGGNSKVVEDLHEYLEAGVGYQHNNLRTIALSVLNRFPQKEWDIAVNFIRSEAKKFDPPHPEWRVEKIIKDAMTFVSNNPKEVDKEIAAEEKKFLKPKNLSQVAEERREEKELEKVAPKTGYDELDDLIIGFVPGHLYTVTGDTNVGKTTLACNFAVKVSEQKKKVLYFALEPENTVIDYLASVKTGKEFSMLTQEDYNFDEHDIHVFGKQDISNIEDLLAVVRESERYDLIIIDHIGYFVRDKNNTNQDQSNVVKQLVGLAKEKRTAIMSIAHLRKRAANQRADYIPTADDISGSGAFKQDSTEVIIVTRKKQSDDPEDMRLSSEGKVIVAKTKCGPNGAFGIIFGEKRARIYSAAELWGEVGLTQDQKLNMLGFPDKDEDQD